MDAARHDRLVTLVTGMLELQKHRSQTTSEREERLIMQEIRSIDRQIDSLVYGLYGLNAIEIALVEESVSKQSSPTKKNKVILGTWKAGSFLP